MTVLIIDDSQAVAERLSEMIAEVPGVTVAGWAKDGSQAAEMLRRQPDVVVLDLQLGDDNGLDILKKFRPLLPRTRFIMLAGSAHPQYRRACILAGADHFFDKTSEFQRVRDVVEGFVGRNHRDRH